MRRTWWVIGLMLLPLAALHTAVAAEPGAKPNIVYILADDIGYGDFGCYGATKVKTPNLDRMAAQGLRFTDAHSPASTCTPSRYALLTGQYAFRKPNTGIASGIDGAIIAPGRTTVPSVLKAAGYATGIVGKWHLGLGKSPTNYNEEIKPGPLEIGFDFAWIMPATGDRVPCVWVENHRVVNLDPADPIKLNYGVKRGAPASIVAGIPRIGSQTGGQAALWNDEQMSTVIVEKSCAFIEQHKDGPFFLEVATHNIHVPRAPNPQFVGKSECGVRGDTLMEFDWSVGKILETLDRLQLTESTLVIVTSDNGGVIDTNGPDKVHGGTVESNNGHKFNGALRGTKGTVWEGGTRVPFIARWPAKIRPGESSALICQVDMLATFAALTGQELAANDAPDSFNVLPDLLGEKRQQPCREYLIEQDNGGEKLALRHGAWKLMPDKKGVDLYDLSADLGETKNLAAEHPEIVSALQAKLKELRQSGRTRP